MFDHDGLRSETLTDLGAFAGPDDLGEEMCGRVSAPPEDLPLAFNPNQIASKTWLLDRVFETVGGRFGTVHILGGWYGALAALVFADIRFRIARVVSYDLDPACAPVAERVNAKQAAEGRFKARTADAGRISYASEVGVKGGLMERPSDLVINTSCEHMPRGVDWFGCIPDGMLLAAQSNDYFDCDEHVNCVTDLAAFKSQVPLSELLYEGSLRRRRYTRFMLIGRK